VFEKGLGVIKTTFNNLSFISLQLALLVEEIGVLGENHPPDKQNVSISHTPRHEPDSNSKLLVVISTDCIDS
jgi:hypothetical protein